jgi:hypothetical protein
LTLALLGLAVVAGAQEATPTPKPPAAPTETTAATPAPQGSPTVIRTVRPRKRVLFPERTPKPEATTEERPRTFWERLFGRRRRPAPTPEEAAATPTATPKATPRPHKVKPASTPAADVDGTPGATPAPKTAKGKTVPVEKTNDVAAPESPAVTNAEPSGTVKTSTPTIAASVPKATPVPKTRKAKEAASVAAAPTPSRKAPVAPGADADADAQEKYKYDVARNKALEDPEVQKLKDKADGATSDEEARKAQRAYNKALFNKMRSLDGSIKDRADRIEASILKRLDTAE